MKKVQLQHILAVARGDKPADLLLKNGQVVNVFTGEIESIEVAIAGESIAALGKGYRAKEEIDLDDHYLVPGLIDTHVHVESSMVTPPQFARAVVPRGVTTAVTDPHEIANVLGVGGIHYMLSASEDLPLTIFVNLPSCVPATHMGTAGANLDVDSLLPLMAHPRVLGLAEFMNVPGAVLGMEGAIEKLVAFSSKHIDGHAPAVTGPWLQAYAASGPATDHECITQEEALEKVRTGIYVLIREASVAKNLRAILPAINNKNLGRFGFCTDDRNPMDLTDEGSIDNHIRIAIEEGFDPVSALRLATLGGAEAFGLKDRGAIAPGRRADLVVIPNLKDFSPKQVFSGGKKVAQNGKVINEWPTPAIDDADVQDTIHVHIENIDLRIPAKNGDQGRLRVIGIIEGQLVTEERIMESTIINGEAVADPDRDLAKLAVVERHGITCQVGLGFVQGLGLKRGAIAGSIGHDCHNLVVAGTNDEDMLAAIDSVRKIGGGLVVVCEGTVTGSVALPIAGLMSDQPAEIVASQVKKITKCARELGIQLHDPFMYLSFMALEVIPHLKLTDQGLVDVEKFDFVPLWVE